MNCILPLFFLFCSALLPEALAQQQLTFRVDMSGQTVSAAGMHVAGSFQSEAGYDSDWLPGATPLTDADNDNIYEVTLNVPAGLYQYKFINGNSWSDPSEEDLTTCGVDDGNGHLNRELSLGTADLRLPVVAFNACNPQLIFSVNMGGETVSAQGVHVAGDFQGLAGYGSDWQEGATPMHDPDGDGIYEVRIALPTGGLFNYKYLNGNNRDAAESVPEACSTTDGNSNRTVEATAEVNRTPVYCFGSCESCGENTTPPSTDYATYWWNDAVFYEIFVRSFYDSNGDGKGDFKGLTEKLDYLNDGDPATTSDLGITGIWLMPMMESPSYHGYDVTDYKATEPDYGTMAEFEAFLAAAHARGIKVIIDFVMNHSSSQHPWFTQSASSTTNAYRDWYTWSETDPGFGGPWGQKVWHYRNGAYYYGIFWDGMPDLNWDNADLKASMWDITRFWLNKGVDGYRIDAVKYLDEDGSTLENTPETFALLEEFNAVVKETKPEAFTVGEAWSNTSSVVPYVQNERLDVCFEFDLASAIQQSVQSGNPGAVRAKLDQVSRAYPKLQYATFLTNHDQNRILNVFDGNMAHMKQAAALYLSMPGVPFLYYGEEVGILGTKPDEDIRKPMQWTSGTNAGFSSGTPWRSINSNYKEFNVETMAADAGSLLNHYKKLIRLRTTYEALRRGYYLPVEADNSSLFSFARVHEQEAVVTVSNLGSSPVSAPSLSIGVSTLEAGTYYATELYGRKALGTLTVDAQGAVNGWSPAGSTLAANQTWLVLLSRDSQVTGLPKEETGIDLQLYPNPATDKVNIRLEREGGQNHQLKVFDISGRQLQAVQFSGPSYLLDTSGWEEGTYFLQIATGGRATAVKRLMLVR